MLSFKLIVHKDISKEELTKICLLKDENWTYGIEKQLDWIENNLSGEDFHLLGYDLEGNLICYANLVVRKIVSHLVEEKTILGIGNVCVSIIQQKKGFGLVLMREINSTLMMKKLSGLLFCNSLTVPFYLKNNWILIKEETLSITLKSLNTNVMIFNNETLKYKDLELIGEVF